LTSFGGKVTICSADAKLRKFTIIKPLPNSIATATASLGNLDNDLTNISNLSVQSMPFTLAYMANSYTWNLEQGKSY